MTRALPKISICIPAYNHEKYVGECIQSVLNQTFHDFEVLITDDASTDGTFDVINSFRDERIRVFRNAVNSGPSVATNNNLAHSRGEYIGFLASDDTYLPEKLELQAKFLDEHPDIDIVFGLPSFIDGDGNILPPEKVAYGSLFDQPNRSRAQWLNYFFFKINCLCGQSALIRRSLMEKVGEYDPRFLQLQDFDYWVRACLHSDIHILRVPLINYRVHFAGENLSLNPGYTGRSYWELSRILWNFTSITDRRFLSEIFPEAAESWADPAIPLALPLARLALSVEHPSWKIFGLELLHETLASGSARGNLEKSGYKLSDFFRATFEADCFNIRKLEETSKGLEAARQLAVTQEARVHELMQLVGNQDARLASLSVSLTDRNVRLAKLDVHTKTLVAQLRDSSTQLERIQSSILWRGTAGLRFIWIFFSRLIFRKKFSFRLDPISQLEPLEEAQRWRSSGNDPYFSLVPDHGGFPGGWVLIKSSLRPTIGNCGPKLYYDTGAGMSEKTAVRLPVTALGTVLELVRLPRMIRQIRWDPMEEKGDFTQHPIVITRMNFLERIIRMLIRVGRVMRNQPKERSEAFGLTWRRALVDLPEAYRVASALRDPDTAGILTAVQHSSNTDITWCIDSPGKWLLPAQQVTISGWCYSRRNPLTGVRVAFEKGTACVNGEYGIPQPDVLLVNPTIKNDRIGFRISVLLPMGASEFRIESQRDGAWVEWCNVAAFVLHRPLPPSQDSDGVTYEDYIQIESETLPQIASVAVAEVEKRSTAPLISIVMPVFNTPLPVLRAAIDSVQEQVLNKWELIAVDDCSTDPRVLETLRAAAATDPRIHIVARAQNGGISEATNEGVSIAQGEWIGLLDHDDTLSPYALALIAREVCANPDVDLLYTDQDKIDGAGKRSEPFFKPDWSPTWLLGVMYLGHFLVFRKKLLDRAGACDSQFNGVQDYELALRLTEYARQIVHIPHVLYHWRMMEGSIAASITAKPRIDELQKLTVQQYLNRKGIRAKAESTAPSQRVRIVPTARSEYPFVSIMIPTRDRPELISRCLDSLYSQTRYPKFEVIIGDNETIDPEALRAIDMYPVVKLNLPGAFHFSRFNNVMATEARGEFLLLLNNDTEIVAPDWLDHLVLHAEGKDVGAVGPILTYADQTVQHAGVILGPRGTADHVMRGFRVDSDGYFGSLSCSREVSAVTGACLMVRTQLYREMGGLCERFVRHYEDVDFCMRLRDRGLRNILVSGTQLVHHESRSRGRQYDYTDRILLLDRWGDVIRAGDPYHSRHFSHDVSYRLSCKGLRA